MLNVADLRAALADLPDAMPIMLDFGGHAIRVHADAFHTVRADDGTPRLAVLTCDA